jgi:hypothetical protein
MAKFFFAPTWEIRGYGPKKLGLIRGQLLFNLGKI